MVKRPNLAQWFFLLNILGLCVILLLMAYQHIKQPKPRVMIIPSEWENSECYIRNVTCPKDEEIWRAVPDTELCDKLIALCTHMEQFRPTISVDIVLGEKSDSSSVCPSAHLNLWDRSRSYGCTVTLFNVDKQLSLDYIYREAPVVSVVTYTIEQEGVYYHANNKTMWYCTMPAADFAALYETIQTYGAGELVSEFYK